MNLYNIIMMILLEMLLSMMKWFVEAVNTPQRKGEWLVGGEGAR